MHTTPVLIIGSGGAGLTVALKLADQGIHSLVLSKAALTEGSTYYAQGGISAVLDAGDTIESHVNDTLRAGAGLCSESAVRYTVENGPGAIQWLIEQGVAFTRNDGEAIETGQFDYHLTQEGGHSHRRVIHVADATGRAVEVALLARAKQSPFIQFLEHYNAIDLITTHKLGKSGPVRCVGAYVLNKNTEEVETIAAQAVVLACGGANSVYLYSSNPHTASGDGMAMAWRAGASLANMEFMQFHPTCLYHPDARTFLITEAVRGEGGHLKLRDGERFMYRFDERAELAPRDIVARAIDHEMKRTGSDHVWLDISHKPADFIKQHFPMIHAHCLTLGYDMTQSALPIVPAAHYTCGGIKTDLRARTTILGLYAVGETACTGLHGANRMASNSLLECFVFGRSAAKDLIELLPDLPLMDNLPEWDDSRVTNSDEQVVVSHNWQEIRRFMWDYVGIVRTTKRLERALHRIELLQAEIAEYYGHFKITTDLIELRNLAMTSELIIRSALQRRESRGLHYTSDYPYTLPIAMDTILTPQGF